jgi:hypothetical protein
MTRALRVLSTAVLSLGLSGAIGITPIRASERHHGRDDRGGDAARIAIGLAITPVPVHVRRKDRAIVGLGSYIVNAQGGCNDCHTCPSYAPGQNPFDGQGSGATNAANFLAGGVPFGPFTSANITPDPTTGLPAGLTLREFLTAIRTGHDPDDPDEILQVMPWPVYRNMTTHDLRAIYAYLSALPHAEPGVCTGSGQ